MPFDFIHADVCPNCPLGVCIEDRRTNRVRGRQTKFRLKQATALNCTVRGVHSRFRRRHGSGPHLRDVHGSFSRERSRCRQALVR